MSRFKAILLFGGVALFTILPALAQDSHYWTHQYGTRSNLLGGAVVGSVLDLSGTYYNPGGLSLLGAEKEELLMFSFVFEYPKISIKGIGPGERSLSDDNLDEAPYLFAGSLPLKGLGDHWLGYSMLNRHQTEFGISGSAVGDFTPFNRFVTEAPAAVDLLFNEKLSEPWYGLTWAYKISEKLGVGISNYLTFRSHRLSYQTTFQLLRDDGHVSMVLDSAEYKYNFYGVLWKIGVAYDLDRITLGLTLTTPGIKLYADGRVGQNTIVIRNDPENPDYMAVDYQDGLNATYKSPLSIGVGMTYKLGRTNLYGTLEGFGGIKEYVVIQGEDFAGQSNGDIIPNRVTHEIDPVLNIAFGVEHPVSQKFTLYGSFWTDQSAAKDESTTNLSAVDWNLYHLMTGTTFTALGSQFTLGIGYSFGSKTEDRPVRSEDPVLGDIARNFFSELKYTYSSLKFVLGFSF